MTAQGSLEIALRAVEEGAFDFIAKPFDLDEVLALVARAAQRPGTAPAACPDGGQDFSASGLIGHSPQMVRAYKLTAHAARTNATVLIEGESGTGKELIARAIHRHGQRADRPFTAVNCSALTETLLESELFGYTRGSFTGAAADRPGLFESTDGGIDLPRRVGHHEPVIPGEPAPRASGERGAAHRQPRSAQDRRARHRRDERQSGRAGRARRVSFGSLLPAQRAGHHLARRCASVEPEDIALLAQHFLKKYGRDQGGQVRIGEDALELLARYAWPGNVRELENTIEYAVAVCADRLITIDDLPERIVERAAPRRSRRPARGPRSSKTAPPSPNWTAATSNSSSPRRTAINRARPRLSGIDRRTIYRYLDPTVSGAMSGVSRRFSEPRSSSA